MNVIYKEESYQIIGICMEVHRQLGMGFLEVVYKDALELEFRNAGIPFKREMKYEIIYKEQLLPHYYIADLIVFGKIILEIKAVSRIADAFMAQTLNYLKVSENKLGLIVNFGEERLNYKRVVF